MSLETRAKKVVLMDRNLVAQLCRGPIARQDKKTNTKSRWSNYKSRTTINERGQKTNNRPLRFKLAFQRKIMRRKRRTAVCVCVLAGAFVSFKLWLYHLNRTVQINDMQILQNCIFHFNLLPSQNNVSAKYPYRLSDSIVLCISPPVRHSHVSTS